MTNRGFLVWTFGPAPLAALAALVGAGCSGGSSGGSGPTHGTGGGGGDSSVASDDAGIGAVPPWSDSDGTTPVGADDASAASSPDSGAAGPADGAVASDPPGWTLTWSDEFNGPDGSAVDPTKWKHDVGGTGWGNNELEYYTDGTQNAVVTGGNLVVTATTRGRLAVQLLVRHLQVHERATAHPGPLLAAVRALRGARADADRQGPLAGHLGAGRQHHPR